MIGRCSSAGKSLLWYLNLRLRPLTIAKRPPPQPYLTQSSWPWNVIHSSGCVALISSSRMRCRQYSNHRERTPPYQPSRSSHNTSAGQAAIKTTQHLCGRVGTREPQIYKADFHHSPPAASHPHASSGGVSCADRMLAVIIIIFAADVWQKRSELWSLRRRHWWMSCSCSLWGFGSLYNHFLAKRTADQRSIQPNFIY